MERLKKTNIAFCNFYSELNVDNFMFVNENTTIGDDLLKPFVELRKQGKLQNINIATVDVLDVNITDAFVFIDMPDLNNFYFLHASAEKKPMYLVILESRHTRVQNYLTSNHSFFNKIFTYDDSIVDNQNILKINYSFNFPKSLPRDCFSKKKLCTLISGNKKTSYRGELYSKREEIIRWFEENHPDQFDFYGTDWDKFTFPQCMIIRHLNRIDFLRKIYRRQYITYKGKVDRKQPILAKYKFSICFENISGIPGYITEKIFDSLIAGCVPIYLGAPNIDQYVPKNCFIDMREFSTIDEMYLFINNMPAAVYEGYLFNIEEYFNSKTSYPFTIDCFVETLLHNIVYD